MMGLARYILAISLALFLAGPAKALDPSEMLADPVLEARARVLDFEIRCVKCQSEAIASSNAAWAKDARRIVRELIAEGATNEEVKSWFLARYGDFVLMDPPKRGMNLALWFAGPILLIAGAFFVLSGFRRRTDAAPATHALSDQEQARLDDLLEK